jgi:Lytic polysaccharide mono-oxygenase, cellulose-degrading
MTKRVFSVAVSTAFALALLCPGSASAHFLLKAPAASQVQDALGNPQKTAPCGGAGTATGTITNYRPGDTVTISIDETVFHPGHYRVALAKNDISELPLPPTVTKGATACGSVPIETAPVFPILADGALKHTSEFSGTQTFQVRLPSNVTCTNCTLQILEFMASHGAPCFYHHCATISIGNSADAGAGATDAGSGAVDAASTAPDAGNGGSVPGPTAIPAKEGGVATDDLAPSDQVPQPGGCSAGGSGHPSSANGLGLGLLAVVTFAAASATRRRRRA